MKYENCFKEMFESIPDYRKIVLLMFVINNEVDLLNEFRFLKCDFNRLCLEFKTSLLEQIEEYLDYNKYEEESMIERILNK